MNEQRKPWDARLRELAVLVLWLPPALLVAKLAQRKGRPFWLYLIGSLIVGWPFPPADPLFDGGDPDQGEAGDDQLALALVGGGGDDLRLARPAHLAQAPAGIGGSFTGAWW
jgi:hypothetical protein